MSLKHESRNRVDFALRGADALLALRPGDIINVTSDGTVRIACCRDPGGLVYYNLFTCGRAVEVHRRIDGVYTFAAMGGGIFRSEETCRLVIDGRTCDLYFPPELKETKQTHACRIYTLLGDIESLGSFFSIDDSVHELFTLLPKQVGVLEINGTIYKRPNAEGFDEWTLAKAEVYARQLLVEAGIPIPTSSKPARD